MTKAWDLKRILTICLGGFWLLDGILQLQPAMFTNVFVNTVLTPNLQSQPSFIEHIVSFGITIFSLNIFWFNLASALIQLFIGILLIFPFQNSAQRFGLWLSIIWALIVWIFGEGFGNLFTGNATFYTGAPGSALLYLILAICLLYSWYGKLPLIAAAIFLIGAFLNLMSMFWQTGILGNLLAVDVLIWLGIFIILVPNRIVAWTTISFLVIVWAIGQSFGGLQTLPGGTATDPNSAPLLILFILPMFFKQPFLLEPSSSKTHRR